MSTKYAVGVTVLVLFLVAIGVAAYLLVMMFLRAPGVS